MIISVLKLLYWWNRTFGRLEALKHFQIAIVNIVGLVYPISNWCFLQIWQNSLRTWTQRNIFKRTVESQSCFPKVCSICWIHLCFHQLISPLWISDIYLRLNFEKWKCTTLEIVSLVLSGFNLHILRFYIFIFILFRSHLIFRIVLLGIKRMISMRLIRQLITFCLIFYLYLVFVWNYILLILFFYSQCFIWIFIFVLLLLMIIFQLAKL